MFFCVQILFEVKNAAHFAKFGEEVPPWSWEEEMEEEEEQEEMKNAVSFMFVNDLSVFECGLKYLVSVISCIKLNDVS